jgi:tetratricopeptide (TPR) repeat protein
VARIYQGDIDGGSALALQGLEETHRLGLHGVESQLQGALGFAASLQGDYVSQLERNRQSLLINRETGDRVNEAIGLLNLGVGWLNLGELVQSRRELDAALALLRANGDRAIEGAALGLLSVLALWEGDETHALALARQALDIAQAAQSRDEAVFATLRLGDAEGALGRLVEARQAYAQAQALARDYDDPKQHDASAGLARVALAAGNAAAALAALQPLLDHTAAGGTLDGTDEPRRIELTCHQVLARAGDPRADAWFVRAHAAVMAQAEAIERSGGRDVTGSERGLRGAALRQGYLQNIPWHREIVAAWARRGVMDDTASAPS